mgnify:CR=1 FL=1
MAPSVDLRWICEPILRSCKWTEVYVYVKSSFRQAFSRNKRLSAPAENWRWVCCLTNLKIIPAAKAPSDISMGSNEFQCSRGRHGFFPAASADWRKVRGVWDRGRYLPRWCRESTVGRTTIRCRTCLLWSRRRSISRRCIGRGRCARAFGFLCTFCLKKRFRERRLVNGGVISKLGTFMGH